MDELIRALVLVGGGSISIILLLLGIKMLCIPSHVWKTEQRRLQKQRRTAEEVVRIFK